ncbi:MAG: tetratricopeptide repeat protein [Burkholderiaceae bacterium]
MAYDLEEQEQIATLKAFWNQYGNFILTLITIILLAIAGWRGWGWYQSRQAAEASAVYEQLKAAAQAKDAAKVKDAAGTLFEKFGGTAYGQMGALLAAKAYHDAGDDKAAKAPLQWAVEKAQDEEFRQLARVRLAGILLDEKAYDKALELLPMESAGRFAGEFADRRGDVMLAQGKRDDARAAYKLALEKLDERSPMRRLVQLKLDALGGVGS